MERCRIARERRARPITTDVDRILMALGIPFGLKEVGAVSTFVQIFLFVG
jgi:hypothetical protein